jgi:hypothetical protein
MKSKKQENSSVAGDGFGFFLSLIIFLARCCEVWLSSGSTREKGQETAAHRVTGRDANLYCNSDIY